MNKLLRYLNLCMILLAIFLSILNIDERYGTNKTTTTITNQGIQDLKFPLKLSILVNPGIEKEQLRDVGYDEYESNAGYYLGVAKEDLQGLQLSWAGHSKEDEVFGNVSGKLEKSLLQGVS